MLTAVFALHAETESRGGALLSGCEYDYAPFCIVREDGQADGFSVELLREALAAMHREVTFKTAPWPELKEDLAEARIQVLPMVARTPEREDEYDFTFPYLNMHGAIVVRSGNTDIRMPKDLRNRAVAVLREDIAHEYLRQAGLGAVIVPLPSFGTALKELSEGKHDAVIVQRLLAFQLMKTLKLDNLKVVGPPLDYTQSFCFAVRKGDTRLLSLLNEGLSIVMADGTFRRLQTKWFAPLSVMGRTRYSIVVGGDSNFAPFEFIDPATGEPAGFNVDLIRAIARQLGLSVEIRLAEWADIQKRAQTGEVDLLQGMFFSPDRATRYAFSSPHSVVHYVPVVRKGDPMPAGLHDLAGRAILVQSGDLMHDVALENGFTNIQSFPSHEIVLRELAGGRGDCALVGRIPAVYQIKRNGWRNLNVSSTPLSVSEYCFAVPEGKESLLADFAEGLEAVKATGEYRRIQNRWLAPYESVKPALRTVLRYSGLIALPLVVLLLGALGWTRSLRKQVIRRTADLQKETQASQAVTAQLRRTVSDLARSNYDLEQFAHVASHDLKEPLRMVTGFLSLLRDYARDRLDDKAKEYIEMASEGGSRMQVLVDDLLAYSRIGRNRKLDTIDSAVILESVLKNLTPAIRESKAAITHDPMPMLCGNATELTQLFQNLIANAIKFRDLRDPVIHIGAHRRADYWQFDVSDNGIGIDKQYQDRIFLIFQRLHTSDRYPGTGIGLALCKKIVEGHGGCIWMDSTLGQGTTFHFTMPIPLSPPAHPA